MFRAFQSASAVERMTAARRFMDELPENTEAVVVGGSRTSADDFVRELAYRRGATVGLHRFSLVQFAVQIGRVEIARRGLAPLTGTGAMALAVRCVFEVRKARGFKFFGPVGDKPGFAAALANTIHELRASGVEPGALAVQGDRGADVGALLTEYVRQLQEGRLADMIDVFEIATEQVESGAAALSRHPVLLLDTPVTSKAERTFMAALGAKSRAVFATVIDGDTRTWSALAQIAKDCATSPAKISTSLDRLQHYLFGSTPDASYPEDGKVQFFSAPGEGRECVEIARRIQEAGRGGVRFDEIAIALRSPQSYAPLLEAALERAGISACFARGARRPDPSGRALIALLLCAEEGLSAKRFAEYLSLGQVPDPEENGEPPQPKDEWVAAQDDMLSDEAGAAEALAPPEPPSEQTDERAPSVAGAIRAPWKWEELLVEAAVVGGRERWKRRLKGLEAEIARKVEAIKLDEPDSPRIARFERERTNLGHLRRFALPILDELARAPQQASWGEWLTLLQRLATMVLRSPEHVLAVLAELRPISNAGPVTLSEVREALSDRLMQLPVEPPRSRYGRVFIGTPEQLRGRAFKIVFVPGLAERIFPQKLREDPLLLDGDRQRLRDADPALATIADRAAEERLRLRIIAGAAAEQVFFSYPRVEVALARPRVPSFYALDVRRTTLGALPNVERFERDAARNSGAELAWMAPDQPHDAIDDIEYDLAVLRPLLKADPKSARGGARYLMELSPELGRSLRTRWQRWHKAWSSADGLCAASDLTREQLAKYRLAARPYSPTSLQAYAACPFRFFLYGIHKLTPREESVPLEVLDPLTRGQLYHAIVAGFLRTALAGKMLPITTANLAEAHAMVEKILTATAEEYHEQYAPAIERVWQDEVELLRADLRGWVTQMSERSDGYLPELIEFAFGLLPAAGRDPASALQHASLPRGFLMHGVIDLVEKNGAGEIRITDHKTGKNRTEDSMVVGGGEVLQPVLYSLSIEDLRKIGVKEARLSYCTAAGGYTERMVVMDEFSRQSAIHVLRTIDGAIAGGFLPAAPKEKGCMWCDFVQVCGPHEELRAGRKDQGALEALVNLRGMR
jgi:ATP-dependent helicase/nuclease subunit B